LDHIADYTLSQWGERQVEIYLGDLDKRFEWLANNPKAGHVRDEWLGDPQT
jgi:toxin ParE1/3/4